MHGMSTPVAHRQSATTSAAGLPRVLGIDPGLVSTGFAVVAAGGRGEGVLIEAGRIRLGREQAIEARLVQLETDLAALIDATRPGVLVCEQLYAHYKHPRTAIRMAHARGVVLALAARRGLQVVHVSATRVKKTLTGSGRASKEQVRRAVCLTLGLDGLDGPHDVSDAIAIALCGLRLLSAPEALRTGGEAG